MFSSLASTKQWKVQIHLYLHGLLLTIYSLGIHKTVKIKVRTYKCQISINKVEASVNLYQESINPFINFIILLLRERSFLFSACAASIYNFFPFPTSLDYYLYLNFQVGKKLIKRYCNSTYPHGPPESTFSFATQKTGDGLGLTCNSKPFVSDIQ